VLAGFVAGGRGGALADGWAGAAVGGAREVATAGGVFARR
jgi:hypothetical protein